MVVVVVVVVVVAAMVVVVVVVVVSRGVHSAPRLARRRLHAHAGPRRLPRDPGRGAAPRAAAAPRGRL